MAGYGSFLAQLQEELDDEPAPAPDDDDEPEDHNESVCGACGGGGELVCCEGCPASFHIRCTGYDSVAEIPDGDWLCWFCAKEQRRPYQHPTALYKPPRGAVPVMLASDEHAELFYRCKVIASSEGYVELRYTDFKNDDEIVHRSSVRLWHGTTEKAAWTLDSDNITWRPHCRLYKVDTNALQQRQRQQLQQLRQQRLAAADAPAGPLPLPAQRPPQLLVQQPSQPQGGGAANLSTLVSGLSALVSRGKPGGAAGPGARGMSPASSSGGAGQGGVVLSPGSIAAVADAERRGVQRVPAGEVGAGLPVITGGASRPAFERALRTVWAAMPAGRPPATPLMSGQQVEAYHLWREVWSWGGPDVVGKTKLWATVGFAFNPPVSATSVSSRIRRSYEAVLAPLDEAIDAGTVELERPQCCRQPTDRALQLRQTRVSTSGATGGNTGGPRASQQQAQSQAPHGTKRGRPPGSGGGDALRSRSGKRARMSSEWSSDDEDSPARDMGSEYEELLEMQEEELFGLGALADAAADGRSDDPEGLSSEGYELDELASEDGGLDGSKARRRSGQRHAAPPRQRSANKARGFASDGVTYVGRPSEAPVMGRIRLTPAAAAIEVGDVVEYRTPLVHGRCASGWVLGTVLATDPGSEWEGGRRLLIQPRRHGHSHGHGHSKAAPVPGSPAEAVALAAVAAAGGPAAGGAAAEAAQRLLTPGGHLRHEVAGLMPSHGPLSPSNSGSAKLQQLASAGSQPQPGQAAPAAAEAEAGAADAAPVWVPFVWRGPALQPFAVPPVLVRPRYAPSTVVSTGGPGAAPVAGSSGSSLEQGAPPQQQQVLQPQAGMGVEVLRDGAWCPAEVVSACSGGDELGAAAGAPAGPSGGAEPGAVSCVVVRSLAPPEADGNVWRCSGTHAMRPAHPQQRAYCGVVVPPRPASDDLMGAMPMSSLRKQLAPYAYAGGIQAFSCVAHMKAGAAARA